MLGRFHKVSESVQKSKLLSSTCAELYSSLQDFLSKIRQDLSKFDQKQKLLGQILTTKLSQGDKE